MKFKHTGISLSTAIIIHFLGFASETTADTSCPGGWKLTDTLPRTCLKTYLSSKSWDEARKVCLTEGADLTKISDFLIFGFIQDKVFWDRKGTFWIGFRNYNAQNDTKRLDDNHTAYRKTTFGNISLSSKTECLAIRKWRRIILEYHPCSQKLHFICNILPVCKNNTYGPKCAKKCSRFCLGVNNTCDKVNGSCVYGCFDGYQGEMCDRACGFNTYGEKCSNSCSPYCGGQNKTCDNINGSCVNGCVAGYQGQLCDKECENNTYGINCSKNCSPYCGGANKSCYHSNGSCIYGCIGAYKGEMCDAVKEAVIVKSSSQDHLKTIAAIVLIFLVAGIVISSIAFSPQGFLTEEDKTGTEPESKEEESRSVESNQLWMMEEFTVQGSEYDSDIGIDQEESNYLS